MKLVAGCYLSTQCCNVRSVADRVFTVVVDSRDSSVQRPNRSDTQRKNLANQLLSVGCQVFSNHDSCAFEFSSLPDDSRFDVVANQFHNYWAWFTIMGRGSFVTLPMRCALRFHHAGRRDWAVVCRGSQTLFHSPPFQFPECHTHGCCCAWSTFLIVQCLE